MLFYLFALAIRPYRLLQCFETGFETGALTGLHQHGTGTIDVTTSPVATGKYAAKYDLIRDNTKGHYRAETFPDHGKNVIEFNKEYWLSMNYIYTDWAKDRSAEIGPLQIHRVPSKWKAGCGGESSCIQCRSLSDVFKK